MLAASFPSFETSNMAHSQQHQTQQPPPPQPAQVAEKVMRRIEIAKVARNLQDCLAFASFKAQNGWQDRTLSTIEPEITEKLARRKRPFPEDLHNDSSSTLSDSHSSSSATIVQGQLDPRDPARSYSDTRKRVRPSSASGLERSVGGNEWNQGHSHAKSSPLLGGRPHTFDNNYQSLQDSPMFDAPTGSEAGDNEVSMSNMNDHTSSVLSSSPPRTPPPTHRRLNAKQAGADALLYMANSPRTPAIHVHHLSSSQKQPATPPQHSQLPSAFLQTPGNNTGLFNGALQTPGNFNLSEFCNVTPSPAQAQFSRTPGRLTRRGLNFDSLVPPSPSDQRNVGHGLALQLGDELLPRS